MQLFRSILGHLIPATIKTNMKISQEGLSLIKKFEGCEYNSYKCAANVWTIGYGHTEGVKEGDLVSQQEAEKLLEKDVEVFEKAVNDAVEVPISQSQFDALVSWTFNLGSGSLNSSTMLKKLNNQEYDEVPAQIKRWNKACGKVLQGLVRRREAEALLYEGKEWSKV